MGGSQDERPKAYRLASPLEHLDEDDPPCLFITERRMTSTRATKFRKRMSDLGISSGIEVIEETTTAAKQVWFDQMIDAADALHEIFEVNGLRTHRHVMQESL